MRSPHIDKRSNWHFIISTNDLDNHYKNSENKGSNFSFLNEMCVTPPHLGLISLRMSGKMSGLECLGWSGKQLTLSKLPVHKCQFAIEDRAVPESLLQMSAVLASMSPLIFGPPSVFSFAHPC